MKAGERTRQAILRTGLALWCADPLKPVSARKIGQEMGITHGAVLYHFKTSDKLRDALASEARRTGAVELVGVLTAVGR